MPTSDPPPPPVPHLLRSFTSSLSGQKAAPPGLPAPPPPSMKSMSSQLRQASRGRINLLRPGVEVVVDHAPSGHSNLWCTIKEQRPRDGSVEVTLTAEQPAWYSQSLTRSSAAASTALAAANRDGEHASTVTTFDGTVAVISEGRTLCAPFGLFPGDQVRCCCAVSAASAQLRPVL